MQRNVFLVLAVVAALVSAGRPAEASGPHFMAEGNLGVASGLGLTETTDGGFSVGALLGVGGRFANSWPRYYFMVEYLTLGYARSHEQNLRSLELGRRFHEIGLVGRVVLPIVPALRLFGDVGVMAVVSGTTFGGSHVAEADSSELDVGMRLAVGAQFRPAERFSVGLRASMTANFDGYDKQTAPGWLVGFESEPGHGELTLQLTIYF